MPNAASLITRLLFILGLIFSWMAAINLAFSTNLSNVYIGDYEHQYFDVIKSNTYYVLHGLGLLFIILSGIIALLSNKHKIVGVTGTIGYVLLSLTGLIWFFIAILSSSEYDVWDSMGGTGFFTWGVSIAVFSATDAKVGQWVSRMVFFLLPITIALFLWSTVRTDYIRIPGASMELKLYLLMWWMGSWYYLSDRKQAIFWFLVRDLIAMLLIVGALYIQSRSWFLLSLIVFIFRRYTIKESLISAKGFIFKVIYSFLLSISLTISLYLLWDLISQALSGFSERVFEDSRSSQYFDFFDSVSIMDLIIGGGPQATWYWPGIGDYQYIDNGILWMLFIGGLPLLIGYWLFIILPGWKNFTNKNIRKNHPELALLFLYFLMLLGFATYTSPSVSFYSYFLYFIAGQSYYRYGFIAQLKNGTR